MRTVFRSFPLWTGVSGFLLVSCLTVSVISAQDAGDAIDPPEFSSGDPQAVPATTRRGHSYWQALVLPGGLETMTQDADGDIRFVTLKLYQDPAPLQPLPMRPVTPSTGTAPADSIASIFRGGPKGTGQSLAGLTRRSGRRGRRGVSDVISGKESKARSTSDAGSLISKSSRNRGVVGQKRNPIITDPRIRGSRIGQLAASGSHWVPARIDLDTVLSKLDSDLISSIDVVKGPYAVEYGPGVGFLAFELNPSPRSDNGPLSGGSSTLEYQTNGERWYGRQTLSHADEDWGIRVGYGHRTGTDYESGDGTGIPSSFNSRNLDVAFGFDVSPGQSLELVYLHQDQTDVELPGQAFDIDSLTTDAFEATWRDQNVTWTDGLEIEAWFHDTQLQGNANSPAKRRTFPFLDQIDFSALTNVMSLSTGASAKAVWELNPDRELAAGVDLRVVRQELDEISSGQVGFVPFDNANSPVPRSAAVNPGLFLELTDTSVENLTLTSGIRTDVVTTEMLADADADRLNNLGTGTMPLSLADILGTRDFDQSFGLWSGFLSAEYAVDDQWTVTAAAGHGQRAPSLTEMYAAESFMFLLQSGLNTITGDPRLDTERRWQIDLGANYKTERFRAAV
ncbi:MAG: TonB-dependent receptor, partial [Planctomycetaceae bacterium]